MKAREVAATVTSPARGRVWDLVRDYYRLTKPDIVLLILLTTLAGMLVVTERSLSPGLVMATLAGVGLASSGGGVFNCYIDRDIDALMRRTARRAIPSGRVPPHHALAFGVALVVAGLAVMLKWAGWLAAALTLAGFLIYVGVYSLWLKRRTPRNIVIGGAAGAMGPLIGWVATGEALGWVPWLLFAIIFLWTPPHFWSLALLTQEDYRRAGVPMLPVVKGEDETRRQVLLYTLALAAVTVAPPLVRLGGWLYAGLAGGASACYVLLAARAWRCPSQQGDGRLFRYSLTYLTVVFLALIASVRWVT